MHHRNSRNPQLLKEMLFLCDSEEERVSGLLKTQKNKFRPWEWRSVLTLLIFILSYQLLQLFSFLLLHLSLPVFHVILQGAKTLISVCFTFSSVLKTCWLFYLNPHKSWAPLLRLHLRYTLQCWWAPSAFPLPPNKTNSPLPPWCTLYCF